MPKRTIQTNHQRTLHH